MKSVLAVNYICVPMLFQLELLEEFSPAVERLGFDENFVDLTEMVEKRLQQLPSDEVPSVTVSGHVYNNQCEFSLRVPSVTVSELSDRCVTTLASI